MTSVKENTAGYRDVLRFATHYWRQGLRLGILSAALMMAAVTMDSIVPIYTGRIVDAMSKHSLHDAVALHKALAAFWGFFVLALLNVAFRTGSMFCWNRFAVHNLYRIVTDGMRKVQRFSADWHANTFAGGTVRKITRGMWAFDQFEDTILMGLLPAATIVISITIMLSYKLPLVGAVTAVLIVIYCALSIWASVRILKPRFIASAAQDTKMGATLADIIVSNPTVKSFGAETREENLFSKVAAVWRDKAIHAWQVALIADGARTLLRILMNGIMLALTIWLWHTGKASPGDIVVVITTFFIIGGYLRDIGMHINHLQRAMSDMEDAVVFWMREDDVVDAADAKPLTVDRKPRRDMISFDHVEFRYSAHGNMIYDDLCIDIASGERLALVGPSGSGKSTFVKLLQRLYNLNSGRILIDGQDIAHVTLESLRQTISLVPQDPILFHRSLSDNIAYGSPHATQEEIVEAAKKAYAHDFITGLPLGYDTLVGERGVKLSGGERQRVAIARAILAGAPILILDEATSSLDSVSEHYIQKALHVLMEGRTTITIAHRLSTIQQADRILVFNQGRIVEQGTHQSLLAVPESHYRKLYEMQVSGLSETAIVA